jgi:hypothetical protein
VNVSTSGMKLMIFFKNLNRITNVLSYGKVA